MGHLTHWHGYKVVVGVSAWMTIHSAREMMINLEFTHRKRLIYYLVFMTQHFFKHTYLIPTRVRGVCYGIEICCRRVAVLSFFPFFFFFTRHEDLLAQ